MKAIKTTAILIILTSILFLPTITAQAQEGDLGVFFTSDCVERTQNCANCTFVNITSVVYPNSSDAIGEVTMSKRNNVYNHTFCDTTQNGEYIVNGVGNPDGDNVVFGYTFTINPIGKILTNAQAVLYFTIFIMSFIFFLLCIIIASTIDGKNKKDEMTGYVLAVSNLKYLKIFLFTIAYLSFTVMMYFGWSISFGYLDLQFLGDIFNFIFITLVVLILPLFVVGTFVVISNAVRDHKVGEALQRGLRIK
jgi:hypothetical protein